MAIKVNNDIVISNEKDITAAEVSATKLTASNILYPVADGATGQVLVTNGQGTLSFGDASPDLTAGDGIDISTANDDTTIKVDLNSTGAGGNGLKIENEKLEVYKATANIFGTVKVPTTGNLSVTDGEISVAKATETTLGVVEVPTTGNLSVDADGKISVAKATASSLGVVQVPTTGNLSVNADGDISVAKATTGSLGVVQVGAGLAVADGVISTDLDALSFVGGIDLTSDPLPSPTPEVGATYVNTVAGGVTATWATALGLTANDPVVIGDLISHKAGDAYTYIATGGAVSEAGASIHVGDTPPAPAAAGNLWWNSADGTLYIYYTDASNDSQWVITSPQPPAAEAPNQLTVVSGDGIVVDTSTDDQATVAVGLVANDAGLKFTTNKLEVSKASATVFGTVKVGTGLQIAANGTLETIPTSSVTISDSAPLTPSHEDLWWNSTDGMMYVYYTDASNDSQWVVASPSSSTTRAAALETAMSELYQDAVLANDFESLKMAVINALSEFG